MVGGKLLLVEDEEIVRRFYQQGLAKAGWSVDSTRTGHEALAALSITRFSVVLCDLDLGRGIDGIEVCRRMPHNAKGTPFVILTGHGTVARCLEAQRAGVTDFVEKPVPLVHLLATLARIVGGEDSQVVESLRVSAGTDGAVSGRLRSGLAFIERNFANPDLSVGEIGAAAAISSEHLGRVFRKHVGMSPLEKVHEIRVKRSKDLLRDPKLIILEVAVQCGYHSTDVFDRWFRRFNACTPSEWRRMFVG